MANRRWTCPKCGGGINAPGRRSSKEDTRYICLDCSAEAGRLVRRTCPANDRDRAARKQSDKAKAQRKRDAQAAREAVYPGCLRPLMEQWRSLPTWDNGRLPKLAIEVRKAKLAKWEIEGYERVATQYHVMLRRGFDECETYACAIAALSWVDASVRYSHERDHAPRRRGAMMRACAHIAGVEARPAPDDHEAYMQARFAFATAISRGKVPGDVEAAELFLVKFDAVDDTRKRPEDRKALGLTP